MQKILPVFENEDCMVFNKPAGLPVQGGAGIGVSLDRLLAERWTPPPLLVHRLDRDTSGLILVARNREAAARFSRLFAGDRGTASPGAGGGIVKRYWAVCAGRPDPPEGRITGSLPIRSGSRRGAPQQAETRYRLLRHGGEFSLLELRLITGRTHQIRRHLAREGNPILGDDKYGDFALNRRLRREQGLKNLLLHAGELCIPGLPELHAPPPPYFAPFLEAMTGNGA
jgi:23S rRNA pseudouridine955/2504/2580 synthase